jgi:ubiquinone/menaquinone biosynthesis C-methylase UbiE
MKDNFSTQSKAYATFRPKLPAEVYDFIFQHVNAFNLAWDVGTGNGQTAVQLAKRFEQVFATDISENQLSHAEQLPNITYKKESAEQSSLADASVDLITIAQAIHWFHFQSFYKEVKRVAKPNAIIAAFTYSLFQVTDERINDLVQHFYWKETQPFWDAERKLVDEEYKTIPFPFKEIEAPTFWMEYQWSLEQLLGYMNTWSAALHYQKRTGKSMIDEFLRNKLDAVATRDQVLTIRFPIHIRIGSVLIL